MSSNKLCYFLEYYLNAIHPIVHCDNTKISVDADINRVAEKCKNFAKEIKSILDAEYVYDVILNINFDENIYENNLNYDGIYICKNYQSSIYHEYIFYNNIYIIKKSDSVPYFISPNATKYSSNNPICLRNFDNTLNIKPYSMPYELINHADIILNICLENNVQNYLELGIRNSPVYDIIKNIVPTIHGVDINDCPNFDGQFFKMTTDEFFNTVKNKYDLIFIDACHDIDYVIRDFKNSLNSLNSHGIIVLHDTYPINESMCHNSLCSDCYKIISHIKINYPNLQMFNFPISPGLCIIKQ